jgi:hypothetical protein
MVLPDLPLNEELIAPMSTVGNGCTDRMCRDKRDALHGNRVPSVLVVLCGILSNQAKAAIRAFGCDKYLGIARKKTDGSHGEAAHPIHGPCDDH